MRGELLVAHAVHVAPSTGIRWFDRTEGLRRADRLDPEQVGILLASVLSGVRVTEPPSDLPRRNQVRPLLVAAGERSWSALAAVARACLLLVDEEGVTATAAEPGRPHGFYPAGAPARLPADATELGAAVLTLLRQP